MATFRRLAHQTVSLVRSPGHNPRFQFRAAAFRGGPAAWIVPATGEVYVHPGHAQELSDGCYPFRGSVRNGCDDYGQHDDGCHRPECVDREPVLVDLS